MCRITQVDAYDLYDFMVVNAQQKNVGEPLVISVYCIPFATSGQIYVVND